MILACLGMWTLLTSCSATNSLSLTVTEPAVVHLPPSIKRVGLINRSVPSEGRGGLATIEAILSAEGLKLDKAGARAALQGLADRLQNSGRFEVVVLPDSIPLAASGLKGMPAALAKKEVEALCKRLGVDAVFSLSYYDTDTQVNASVGVVESDVPLGIPVKLPAHQLELNTAVRSGWRLYLPELPLPLDQWEYTDFLQVRGSGINPLEALNSIANRKERILDLSRETGFLHGGRLEAARIRVNREYFVRGTPAFARGKRLARTGAWNAAARLWEQETTHPKRKVAGRAHHNMAIINEINGDLEAALVWAREAYATYGNRQALRYSQILQHRRNQEEVLQAQLAQADR